MTISKGNYWTSGSDLDCPKRFFWCSKESEFINAQVSWKSGHPDSNSGACVHAEVGKNITFLATSDCSARLNFVCETRKKGTDFEGLTFECMDLYDVSDGVYLTRFTHILMLIFLLAEVQDLLLNGYNLQNSTLRIKVKM
jgi:hypothetical protein